MKLEQSFEVVAPLQRVWETLIDVQRVAPCLPGAEVTEVADDGTYHGSFQVKLGPTTASYRGTLRVESLDQAAHRATMRATGTDKRGQGGARATMVSTMTQEDTSTRVTVETDFTITGRLARFGRGGMIEDVSNRLLRDFADCLRSTLEQEQPGAGEPESAGAPATPSAGPTPSTAPTPRVGLAQPGGPAAPSAPTPAPGPTPQAGATPPPRARPPAARPAKPIGAFSLILRVLLDRVRRALGRSARP